MKHSHETTPATQPVIPQPVITVTLLGTGVPLLNATALAAGDRALSGLLVQAGTERMLFDCGQGVYTRLVESVSTLPTPNIAVDKLFISHLHSDHIGDLGPLYSVGALYRNTDSDGNIDQTFPLRVWGPGDGTHQPVATTVMMEAFRQAYDTDFTVRELFTNPGDFSVDDKAIAVDATDITPGVIYSNNGVTVTAFPVNHCPMAPSYGFRVDYKGRSFVYSGDTTPIESVEKYAHKVDLLVHEAYGYPREGAPEIFDYHTSPEGAAGVFKKTTPTQAVYTHMVMPPGTTPNDLVARTRAAGYDGPLMPGLDLMIIEINSDATVTITQPAGAEALHDKPATSHPVEVHRSKQKQKAIAATATAQIPAPFPDPETSPVKWGIKGFIAEHKLLPTDFISAFIPSFAPAQLAVFSDPTREVRSHYTFDAASGIFQAHSIPVALGSRGISPEWTDFVGLSIASVTVKIDRVYAVSYPRPTILVTGLITAGTPVYGDLIGTPHGFGFSWDPTLSSDIGNASNFTVLVGGITVVSSLHGSVNVTAAEKPKVKKLERAASA